MMERVVLVRGPLPWWGVLWWCVARLLAGAYGGGAWPPSWLGVVCWCVAPVMVGRAVVVVVVHGAPLGGECCVGAWHP